MQRFLQAIGFYILLPWLYLIALLPFSWLYRLSDLCFLLVYYVIRYRRKVVWSNLNFIFTNKTHDDLKQLNRNFYQYLCDLLLEQLKALTMSPSEAKQRCQLQNPALLQQLYDQGRHIILLTGHYGNWEWAGNSIALQTPYQMYAVYQPLSNPYFDGLLKRIRTRFNRKVVAQTQALRTMLHYTVPSATALLADQAPPPSQAYVIPFLNQPTYIAQGPEKLAKKLHHAVIYISTQRKKRGYYSLHASLISSHPNTELPTLITQAYTRNLEADIQQQPATWLWSHRRWKNKARCLHP
jgi:KDO2-lipid IV(A) lauroyltransferase